MVMGSSPSGHVLYVYTGFQCPARISKPCRSAALASRFSHSDWLFEVKWDGFRSLVRIDSGVCKLMSRNGNQFRSFSVLNEAIIYWDAHKRPSPGNPL
jgi:ATP-dependent DNA ligase